MRLSFIIPVYNVESYIDRCVASVLAQGLSPDDYEVILVDDHSSDSSFSKCQEWVMRYDNIHLVSHIVNQGVGAARNTGISNSKGDFLLFLDSDDYLSPNGISYLFDTFDVDRYDLVRYWSRIVEEGEVVNDTDCSGIINYEGRGDDFVIQFGFDSFCWPFLYRKEWLIEKGISFTRNKLGEDYLFISEVFLNNPIILSTTCRIYCYIKRNGSITTDRSRSKSADNARSINAVISELISYAKSIGYSEESLMMKYVKQSAQNKLFSFVSRVLISDISKAEFEEMISSMRGQGIIPLSNYSDSIRGRIYSTCINCVLSHPSFLLLYRYLYRFVLHPVIVMNISKN